MLQNLTNTLVNTAAFEHRPLKIYSRLTHALKILYFGIHLVDKEDTLQYQDQFSTLFRALTQVVYQSTENSTSAQKHELAGTGFPTTSQAHALVQFIHDSSMELKAVVNTITEACLAHIQRQDIKSVDKKWKGRLQDPMMEYKSWTSLFKPNETVFEDSFIEWLLTLYMASQSIQDDLDEEINQRFYRIRQLGLVTKVREKYPML